MSVILAQLVTIVLKPSARLLTQDPSDFFKATSCPPKLCLLSRVLAEHSQQSVHTSQPPQVKDQVTCVLFPCAGLPISLFPQISSTAKWHQTTGIFPQLGLHSSKSQPFQSSGAALGTAGPDLKTVTRLILGWAGNLPVKQKQQCSLGAQKEQIRTYIVGKMFKQKQLLVT